MCAGGGGAKEGGGGVQLVRGVWRGTGAGGVGHLELSVSPQSIAP